MKSCRCNRLVIFTGFLNPEVDFDFLDDSLDVWLFSSAPSG